MCDCGKVTIKSDELHEKLEHEKAKLKDTLKRAKETKDAHDKISGQFSIAVRRRSFEQRGASVHTEISLATSRCAVYCSLSLTFVEVESRTRNFLPLTFRYKRVGPPGGGMDRRSSLAPSGRPQVPLATGQ